MGGYARFVAICPPGWRHGVRIGQVPEAPLRKYASPLHWDAADAACACASADSCRTLGAMRVRFAPSPTGQLHIGGARTALYNWLVARGQGGTLVLRIEDTDRERSTPENVEQILDALRWLEIDYDEGPISQVARSDRHQEVLQRLLDAGPRLPLDRDGRRRQGLQGASTAPTAASAARRRPRARCACACPTRARPSSTTSSAATPPSSTSTWTTPSSPAPTAASSTTSRSPSTTSTPRSRTSSAARTTSPTRPSSCSCSRRSGAEPPVYAHLPLLHGPDGKKLSKRHGAASVQELRDAGYLPEAVRNYLALLGWGDADDETLISTDELVKRFRIERVSRNPAQFDEQKLRWMNGRYMRELGTDEITRRLEELTGRSGLRDAVAISEEKIQTLADFWPLAGFIFDGPADDPAAREKWLADGGREALADARAALAGASSRSTPSTSSRRCAAWSRRAAPSPRTSSSRCASRWPEPRSRRASSRPSRCSAATSRCARIDAALRT